VYTAFWQYSTRGTPMLRPLTFLDQNNPETYLRQAEFGFGDSLLVCPVTQAGTEGRWLYLPKGEWYYYWDDAPTAGGREVWAAADLTRIPLYVRAGAVLPMQPVLQYVGEKPVDELTLHVYFKNGTHQSVLYDDGGEGYGYQQGDRTVRRFTVVGSGNALVISQEIQGDYQPSYATYRVVLHGLPGTVQAATADGQPVALGELLAAEATVAAPALVVGAGFGEVKTDFAAPVATIAAKA
jgi:alpha-glucosidase